MIPRGTALAVHHHETWPEYILRVTNGVSRKEIAHAADVNVSGVSRWITGTSRPSVEKVVAFARELRLNPVEALVAAGYLDPAEIEGAVEVVRPPSHMSDAELLRELAERLARSSDVVADDPEDLARAVASWRRPQKKPGVLGPHDRKKGSQAGG